MQYDGTQLDTRTIGSCRNCRYLKAKYIASSSTLVGFLVILLKNVVKEKEGISCAFENALPRSIQPLSKRVGMLDLSSGLGAAPGIFRY